MQYTNPGAYPPLEHGSRILAERGWEVLFLGTGSANSNSLQFADMPGVRVELMPFERPGWRQKLHYIRFNLWCASRAISWRPDWIYCSDLFSCPFGGLAGSARRKVIYHEHDSPAPEGSNAFDRFLLRARRSCARRARMVVLPNERRARILRESCGLNSSPDIVWNCPRRSEALVAREPIEPGSLKLLYHGSIVPDRLPLAVVDAIAAVRARVSLTVVGYETAGSSGYLDRMRARATELGIAERLRILGTLPKREDLMAVCRGHDAGFALMPESSADLNLEAMEGASNKPFDYLACGLALIVSRRPEWERIFVAPGYGYSCSPASATDIAGVIAKLAGDPARTRAMGEAGRQRVLSEWNYEHQFEPVLNLLEKGNHAATAGTPARAAEVAGR